MEFGSPHCVINAISDALHMAHIGFGTRIAEYPTDKPGVNHAQAQALVKDRWEYLTHHMADGIVRVWPRHYQKQSGDAETHKPVRQFIDEQLPNLGL